MNNKSINNISTSLYHSTRKIYDEYITFIENENENVIDKDVKHITGGISSGVSSSSEFMYKGIDIKLWYDISFIELLNNRYKLIEDWIENVNNNVQEDKKITINDIQTILNSKKIIRSLKNLFKSLEIYDYNVFLYSFLSLVKKKKGRCTSGIRTFLNVLRKKTQNLLRKSDSDKQFIVSFEMKYTRNCDKLLYEDEVNRIENEIDKKYNKPIFMVFQEGMKEDDKINIHSENKDFEWNIPVGFLTNYKIGDKIEIKKPYLPFEIMQDLFDKKWEATKKIKKPIEFKKKYDISFNIGEIEEFKSKFKEYSEDFILHLKEFEDINGFGEYTILYDDK